MSNENRKCISCQNELVPVKELIIDKGYTGQQKVVPTRDLQTEIPSGGSQSQEYLQFACKNCGLVQEFIQWKS
jgi:hypothetical protein